VTSADIAFRIQADLGPTWPRNRPLPNDVVAEICEALWEEGVNPNRPIVQQRMPVWNDNAFGPFRTRDSCRLCVTDSPERTGKGHQSCNRPCAVDILRSGK